MTIHIHFTPDGKGVVLDHSGAVNGEDLATAIQQAYESEQFPGIKYWISDRTRCTDYDVSAIQVEAVAEHTRIARNRNPDLLVALVSPSQLQFGISRMLQNLTDEELNTTLVCESREEADAWIARNLGDTIV